MVLCGSVAGAAPHRVYSHLMNPRENPDDSRRAVRPPDWSLFGGLTQFTALRGFDIKDGRIINFEHEITKS